MKISTKSKFSFILFPLLLANISFALAQVSITQPNNGRGISNDLSSSPSAPAPAYTVLDNIVITDNAIGDFANGTDRKIQLDLPAGWVFDTSGGAVSSVGPNLSSTATISSITTNSIIINYSASGTEAVGNSITISGLKVQSTTGSVGSEVYITRVNTSDQAVINGFNNGNPVAPLSKVPGAFKLLQVLLPGQNNDPGTLTGQSSSAVVTAIAGANIVINVNAVDYAYNIVPTAPNNLISLSSNNNFTTISPDMTLVAGSAQFSVSMLKYSATPATYFTVTAANLTNGSVLPAVSSDISISAAPFAKLVMLFPGESLNPGSTTGKTGTPSTAPISGVNYPVTVYSVDQYWNRATSTDGVTISSTAPHFNAPAAASMVDGEISFNLIFTKAGSTPAVTATDNTDGAKSPYTQVLAAVSVGAFDRLQVLLPGENAAPGTLLGKTGTPSPRNAGTQFSITVNAVDANWNIVNSITSEVSISNVNTSYNTTSTLPNNKLLVNGTESFFVTEKTAATNHQLSATNVSVPGMTVANSESFTVNAVSYSKLLVILPGETYAPGTASGKSGTASPIAAGADLTLTVRAVDLNSNTVTSFPGTVTLSSNDTKATFTPSSGVLTAGTGNFIFKTPKAGNTSTITVTNSPRTYTTDPITVTAGAFTKLVLIMPGEVDIQGETGGKSGTIEPQVAGEPFAISVKASDDNGNTVTSVNDLVSFFAEGDIYAQLPSNTALVNGVLETQATFRIGSPLANKRLNVSNVTDNTKESSRSNEFIVNIGEYAGLLITLPGEIYTPGALNGKTYSASNQTVNLPFNVQVRAVDYAFNQITTVSDNVEMTSTDGAAGLPANFALINGEKINIAVTLTISANLTATSDDLSKQPYSTPTILVLAATTDDDYFRTVVVNGDWNNSSTWESSSDNTTWGPSTKFPTFDSQDILIRNGHTVNITEGISLDQVFIESGAQVNVNGGTLRIRQGTGDDFVVAGTLQNNRRNVNVDAGAILKVDASGKYKHNFTNGSSTIPTATWANGSVCEVTYTSYAGDVAGSNQNFSDFIWNSPAQPTSISLLNGFSAKNLTVSTGSGTLNLGSTGGSTTITGNYTQTAGNVVVNKTSGTQNFNVAGSFLVNGGNFTLGNGVVNLTFNGSGNQNLVNAGSPIIFQNVIFSNGGTKTLSSGSFVLGNTNTLTMGANTILNSNGNLTLKSAAASSATIASIPSTSAINGNVKVERYISGGNLDPYRTYRMLSSPTHNGSNAYSFTAFIDDMIVTGTGGAANGFDGTVGNGTSAWTHNGGYVPVTNINTTINAGRGAYLFYRGDRSNFAQKTTSPFINPESLTMDFEGVLNQQDVSVPLHVGYNLVGNPYASSIDWNSPGLGKTGILSVIRIWNPSIRDYSIYDGVTSLGGGSNIIPAGQAFFIQGSVGSNLTFTESAKVADQASPLLMNINGGNNLTLNGGKAGNDIGGLLNLTPKVDFRLILKKEGSPYGAESAVVFQEGRSNSYSVYEDVTYAANEEAYGTEVFLSSISTDKNLAINYLPKLVENAKVHFDLTNKNKSGNYSFKISYTDLPTGYIVRVNDKFAATSAIVENNESYNFTIDETLSGTSGSDRFSVTFEAPKTLPVELTSFNGTKVNEGVAVKWTTATETNHKKFKLERAGDDKIYANIYSVDGKGNNSSYLYIDKTPLLGNNYYRLVQVDMNEKEVPTAPFVINYIGSIDRELISLFPNPVVNEFTVKYNGTLTGNQKMLKIFSTTGQVLVTKTVAQSELSTGYKLDISNFAAGLYIVEIWENGNQRVGQIKLIKQ